MGYCNNYRYDGYSNPNFVWREVSYPFVLSFEEKLEKSMKEAKEINRVVENKEHTIKSVNVKKEGLVGL